MAGQGKVSTRLGRFAALPRATLPQDAVDVPRTQYEFKNTVSKEARRNIRNRLTLKGNFLLMFL